MASMSFPFTKRPGPAEVLAFWFGPDWPCDWPAEDRNPVWFGGGEALDQTLRERFGPLLDAALNGGLTDWESSLHHRLALVILLDQFSRNIHRGQARAFAGDGLAQKLVLQTLALGLDADLPVAGRLFLYMPLMHAESVALQHECLQRVTRLVQHSPPHIAPALQGNLRSARQHMDIIERFGRFPHRNAALGRTSTPEETAFLQDGPRFGQ
jgi:uncharacterized protein (DUF924 family)